MLQQTRVETVIPYYARFLRKFPSLNALARADDDELLACWSGLGYYARARNLLRAARLIAGRGGFPRDYRQLLELPGVGPYTAAALASIAFGVPRVALDGNMARVLARVTAEPGDVRSPGTRKRLLDFAQREFFDGLPAHRAHPGISNQALMELGATVCVPRAPACPLCPLETLCQARQLGREREIPPKPGRAEPERVEQTLAVVRRNGRLLLARRGAGQAQLAGFWELPEAGRLRGLKDAECAGSFRHSITRRRYRFTVVTGRLARTPPGFEWVAAAELERLPLATTARKALRLLGRGA
ncbi:MAG: A/G-specific adenine glycosylase [Acidobacteria bacterium]|nr:A/G-specific adenine glycosylase [Acidobacteriota bacterium]